MASAVENGSRVGKWLGAVRRWYRPPDRPVVPSRFIGLALGGGFARGITPVGVLRVFEQYQIPIHYIAGVSAGSMAAAAYASGSTPGELGKISTATRFTSRSKWLITKKGKWI